MIIIYLLHKYKTNIYWQKAIYWIFICDELKLFLNTFNLKLVKQNI